MKILNWKKFVIKDIFDFIPTKGTKTEDLLEGNDIPYISAKKNNNGLEKMCSSKTIDFISDGNCIVFIQIGAGSAGYTTYQDDKFIGMSGKTICGYNKNLNKYNGIFIETILDMERPKYSFGRSWTGDRLFNTKILLPAIRNKNNEYEPNWQFMEDYIKEKYDKIEKEFKTRNDNNYNKIDKNNWKEFKIGGKDGLFDVFGSKTTKLDDLNYEYGLGKYPYVTTQAINNGVAGFYNYYTEQGNVLVADSAVLGFVTYQEENFSASDHVEILKPKFKMNKYTALFFTTILNKENYRYSYGRKFNQTNIKNTIIKLPVIKKDNGEYEPNWQYMEDYIKSLPYGDLI